MSLSPVVGIHDVRDEVHLVSHKTNMTPVVKFLPDGVGEWTGTPSLLTWAGGQRSIEFVFENESTVRLRGTGGAGIRIEAVSAEMYVDQSDASYVMVVSGTGRRYRVTAVTGSPLDTYRVYDRAVPGQPWVAVRGGQQTWEIAIEEMDTGGLPHPYADEFDMLVAAQAASFESYLEVVAPWRSSRTPGVTAAVYVDWASTVAPDGFVTRPAMLMSKQWMDKVWSWDHCFNALAVARDASAAWDQYVFMFDHQTASGGLPDSITHSEILYNYSKPPIHGWTLTQLLPRLSTAPSKEDLLSAMTALEHFTSWWQTTMTAPGSPFAHYHFGNDSGWDNATVFDTIAPLEMPDLSAFLVLQMEAIAAVARHLGEEERAARWERSAAQLLDDLLATFWKGDRFVARQARTGDERWSQCLLLTMPIVLGHRLPAEVVDSLALTIESHLTEFGLATENPQSELYESDGYWRGPIWAPSTYLIVHGLRDAGRTELAERVSARFRAMCERYGFAENFDALTGEGLRDRSYTWTASVYLLLAEEFELTSER